MEEIKITEETELDLALGETSETVAPTVLFEDTSKSTENVKHYRMSNGSYIARSFDSTSEASQASVASVLSESANAKTGTVVDLVTVNSASTSTSARQVGVDSNGVFYRLYLKVDYPKLPKGAKFISAHLNIHQTSYYNSLGEYEVYRCTENWNKNTISWSNLPQKEHCPLQTIEGKDRDSNTEIQIDITSEAARWYREQTDNCGFVITTPTGTSSSYAKYIKFAGGISPTLEVNYIMMDEYADNQQYETFNVGKAGNGAVNLFTGQLTFVHDDVSVPIGNIPLNLSHIYRSEYADIDGANTFGKGWNISANQTVTEESNQYVYTDGQGRKHYFRDCDEVSCNIFHDTAGIGLKYNSTNKTVMDEKGNTLLFQDVTASNVKILKNHTNNREASVGVEYNADNKVTKLTDCHLRTVELTYSDGNLSKVKDKKNRETEYTYDGDKLITITYPDGKSTEFTYNSNELLTKIVDQTGLCYDIAYENDASHRVASITEYSNKYITNDSVESRQIGRAHV